MEGVRAVLDALETGAEPLLLLVREGDEQDVPASTPPYRVVAPDLFATLTDTVHPQGLLGVFPFQEREPDQGGAALYLVADRISDPGNLGTLLRSAAAAGVSAVVVMPETVDPYNPKVVRAAMGAHFRIPLLHFSHARLTWVADQTHIRVLADLGDYPAYDAFDWSQGVAIVVSSETAGPSDLALSFATDRVTIPMENSIESLNAGVAGSILLFEAARQRRARTTRP